MTGGEDTPRLPDWETWARVAALFQDALALDASDREAFVRGLRERDVELGREVDSLLAAHEGSGPVDRLAERIFPQNDREPGGREPEYEITPGTTLSNYRILARLGAGGMGVVYRARDDSLSRDVALKFLSRSFEVSGEATRRFLTEARAAAALDHPNICVVHEFGATPDGRLFLAMPYYEGSTLKEIIGRGAIPPARACDLALQVARGLDHAHRHEIVHRDIKPANVIVLSGDAVKILDFGIAKAGDVTLTGPGARLGTVAYMSPEQVRGDEVDGRADVWSLGVVLYEMLTARRPFRGGSDRALLDAILSRDPPGNEMGNLPPGLRALLSRALSKNREDRHASAAELVGELEASLDLPAPRTGSARFGGDGEALPREGEWRHVCVVTSRIEGYRQMVERLAPDELELTADQIRATADEIFREHGGRLKDSAEGILTGLFGVPVANEDDSHRAVRATLALGEQVDALSARLTERIQGSIHLRTGVDAGTALARPAEDERGLRVSGDVIDTARGLSARARNGQILVSGSCERALRQYFETEALEGMELPGSSGPVDVYLVVGRTRFRDRLLAAAGDVTPFAGRKEERRCLEEALEAAVDGRGRFVTVTGEAGVGKSRLLYEFRREIDDDRAAVLLGRCVSYGGRRPYRPWLEALQDLLGLPELPDADEEDVAIRVRAISPDLEKFLPFLLYLFSIPSERYPLPAHLEREHLRAAVFESLAAVFTRAAASRPRVIVLEDWHWADEGSCEILTRFLELIPAHPVFLAVTSRHDRPTAPADPATPVRIQLGSLTEEDTSSIVCHGLEADTLESGLAARLLERTDGNPFYLEELCRAFREEGAVRVEDGRAFLTRDFEDLRLPDTIEGVIRARLDRLDRGAREIVRIAAVIGREFDGRVLDLADRRSGFAGGQCEVEQSLRTLRNMGLITQVRELPGPVYRFRHSLSQAVVYDSLVQHRRRALHEHVGRALEETLAERKEKHPELLAHHFSGAEDWKRAVRYGQQAADRALRLVRFGEAMEWSESILSWLSRLPAGPARDQTEVEVLLQLEHICETLGQRVRQQEIIHRLLELLASKQDIPRLAEVHRRQGELSTLLDRSAAAEQALQSSLDLAGALGDAGLRRNALRSLGLLWWRQDRNAEALEAMEEALAIDRTRGDRGAIAGDLMNVGQVLRSLGEYSRALEVLHEGLELAEAVGDPFKQAYMLHNLGIVHHELGDSDAAIDLIERGHALCDERLPAEQSFYLTRIAQIRIERGELEEGLGGYRRAVEITRRAGTAEALAQSLRLLGEVLLEVMRHEEAVPCLHEAADLFSGMRLTSTEAQLRTLQATAEEYLGRTQAASETWRASRALYRESGDAPGELRAAAGFARVLRLSRDSMAADACRDVIGLAELLGDRSQQGEWLNSLAVMEWEQGEYGEALVCYFRALEAFRELGDRRSEGLMLNSIGVTLTALGRVREAAEYLQEGVCLNRASGSRLLEGHALGALGDVHLALGDEKEGERCYEASLIIRRELGDRRGEGWMLFGLARAAPDGEAKERLTAARLIAEDCGDIELLDACRHFRNAGRAAEGG